MTGPSIRHRFDETFETADGCRIRYSVEGKSGGPRIALIHSLALDRSFWGRVVHKLGAFAEVLTYDCRGHGRSSRASGPYTTELMADDLAALLDHLGWQTANVAGCSMGGCIAQAFAIRHAHRLNGLCLIDTTAWYGEDAPTQWCARAQRARQEGLSSLLGFQIERWVSAEFRRANPGLLDHFGAVFLSNDHACYEASCEMLGDADLRAGVRGISVPTTILVGEHDEATPPAMARWLHDAIPHSTLTVINGCKHLSPIERPDAVADALLRLTSPAVSAA